LKHEKAIFLKYADGMIDYLEYAVIRVIACKNGTLIIEAYDEKYDLDEEIENVKEFVIFEEE
jgi:hypothetical protein